jgi:hypothetical protein
LETFSGRSELPHYRFRHGVTGVAEVSQTKQKIRSVTGPVYSDAVTDKKDDGSSILALVIAGSISLK